jgi:hypothetical protein
LLPQLGQSVVQVEVEEEEEAGVAVGANVPAVAVMATTRRRQQQQRHAVIRFFWAEKFASEDEVVSAHLEQESDYPITVRTQQVVHPDEVDLYDFFCEFPKNVDHQQP